MRILIALALVGSSAVAQVAPSRTPNVPPESFQAMRWRLIGPFRAGRVVTATGVPRSPNEFYFGAVGGGIWHTTDAGTTWTPLFDAQPVASIGALELCASATDILYAGTGEADIRSDIAFGNGVYKSTDGGEHWQNMGLRNTLHIGRIVVHPTNPHIVYVAALGHAYAASDERGVYRSFDGGKHWERTLDPGPDTGAVDLAMDDEDPNILYATTWNARRTPWSQYPPNQGPGSGLYKSRDAGKTWTRMEGHGLPPGEWRRSGVAIARGTRGSRVYLLLDATEAGLYRSDDAGENWVRVSADPRITSRAWYFSFIAADPKNPDIVYIPNVALLKSIDGGKTFSVLRGAPGGDDYHSIWIDPREPKRMIIGTDQGASISLNGGETWSTWYNQPTGQLYHVVTDNQFPYNVCGSQQDSGTVCLPSRTNHFAITERDFVSVGGNEAGWVAPDPKDSNVVFATDVYGTVTRFDKRTGQAQVVTPWPVPAFGRNISERKYRAPWTPPLVFSAADPKALYLGTQFLLKTLDGGLHWQKVSPDLTGDERADAHPTCPPDATLASAKPCGYGVIYSIAPSPLHPEQIWTGSDSGLIYLTRDAGKHWTNVTAPAITDWSKITHVEASHFDAAVAYAAVDRHRLDDYGPHLYRTRDFGKTWTEITKGIGEHAFLNAIREDPKRRGLLFAATETGVYTSFDDGDNWQALQLNLPPASVRDLVIQGDDLVVATHGRSFWILDNITPLRQFSAKVYTAGAFLFAPATGVRMFNESFQGTPLPPEIPAGKNPPEGLAIDFWLTSAAPVTLDVLDSRGAVVRHFASGAAASAVAHNVPIAERWLTPTPALTGNPGHNRFYWDLRHEGPSASVGEEDPEIGAVHGPLVIPGDYSVRLSVNGAQFTKPVHIIQDPRSAVDLKTLTAQRDFALRIVSALKDVEELGEKLKSKGSAASAQTQQLAKIQMALTSALAAATSADRPVPAQAVELFAETKAELDHLHKSANTSQ